MTTGTTVARSQEAQSYLDRVGAALADLPEEERADLLDELGTHVDEIASSRQWTRPGSGSTTPSPTATSTPRPAR